MRDAGRLSLRRQLLLWLLLPQLALWAAGGLLAYRFALGTAEEGIDRALAQSVRALARQVKPLGAGLLIDFPRAAQDILQQDPEDPLLYMVSSPPGRFLLGNPQLPQLPQPEPAFTQVGVPHFYGGSLGELPLRLVALDLDYGEPGSPQRLRVQVGKSFAVQEQIARQLVADMLVPLLVLGGLLSLLVHAGIRRGLAPLRRLTMQIEDRSVEALSPLRVTEAPTEVHALVRAINGLLEAVSRSLNQERRFLNDAAHQMRTPLAGLINQAELAQADCSDPVVAARLEKVLTGARRSAHLLHQLLTLARSESRQSVQTLDLAELARDLARVWTPRALAAHIDLGYEGLTQLAIEGDALQLREALTNMIDNALRYVPAGGRVTLRVGETPSMGLLMVEDDGPGVAAQDREHLFERFWRGNGTLAEGCGLGLAIVREIAARHGGRALAEPVHPHGLRIVLQLPRTGSTLPVTPLSAPHGDER